MPEENSPCTSLGAIKESRDLQRLNQRDNSIEEAQLFLEASHACQARLAAEKSQSGLAERCSAVVMAQSIEKLYRFGLKLFRRTQLYA